MRIAKTIFIVFGFYAVALIFEVLMSLSSPDYQGGIGLVVILASLGFMATKVGYRWFDCFFAVIPIYGIFFIFRLAHRAANLPNVDWEQRVN